MIHKRFVRGGGGLPVEMIYSPLCLLLRQRRQGQKYVTCLL